MTSSRLKTFFYLLMAIFLLSSSLFLLSEPDQGKEVPPETKAEISRCFYQPLQTWFKGTELSWSPLKPAPGDFLVLQVGPIDSKSEVTLEFAFPGTLSEEYHTDEHYFAIVAISYDTEPGLYALSMESSRQGPGEAEIISLQNEITIADKDFPVQRFTMPPDRTAGWTAERLAEDRERMQNAWEETKPYPLWTENFSPPVTEGWVSSEFAAIRYINNLPPRRHHGIDIAAIQGTPVKAINHGIVRLADFLLSGGNTVIIDHGIGLSSGYMHLDTINVEEGAFVEKEEIIGTVGMTGYATGPHLHWELRVGQTAVNPDQAMDDDLLLIAPPNLKIFSE